MSKKVFILNFGCQMNKLDTALVAAALKKADFSVTDSVKEADAVLINTCSVRQHAEQRVLSHLGHLQHITQTRTCRQRTTPVVLPDACCPVSFGKYLELIPKIHIIAIQEIGRVRLKTDALLKLAA